MEEERDREARRPVVSPEQLQRIREKNAALTAERLLAARRRHDEQARQAELAASAPPPLVTAERDPQRLTAPTAAAAARRERVRADLAGDREPAPLGYFAIMRPTVIHTPQRAVPSWRAGT